MAAKRDPEVAAFMARVMAGMGITRPSELIDLLVQEGAVTPSQIRKIPRWISGESAPNHKMTVWLLERAGLLEDPPRQEAA